MISDFFVSMDKLLPYPPPRIGVAVSGGSDSMFLALHLQAWALSRQCVIVPFIVDHGLRHNSAEEAHTVALWLEKVGMKPHILSGPLLMHHTGLPEKARAFRYHLLASAGHGVHVHTICLGHQQDDVLETVLMRQQAHSTWRGLAGLSTYTHRWGISWLRPLLHFPRSHLQNWLSNHGIPWICDPTNEDLHFSRPRYRKKVQTLSQDQRQDLWAHIMNYGYKRQEESRILFQAFPYEVEPWGGLRFPRIFFLRLPQDWAILIMQNWIYSLKYQQRPLKISSLLHGWKVLTAAMEKNDHRPHIVYTLGGCLWILHQECLFVIPEAMGRHKRKPTLFQGYSNALHTQEKNRLPLWWDSRFLDFEKSSWAPQLSTPIPFTLRKEEKKTHPYNHWEHPPEISPSWLSSYSKACFPPHFPSPFLRFIPCAVPSPIFYPPISVS